MVQRAQVWSKRSWQVVSIAVTQKVEANNDAHPNPG